MISVVKKARVPLAEYNSALPGNVFGNQTDVNHGRDARATENHRVGGACPTSSGIAVGPKLTLCFELTVSFCSSNFRFSVE